MFNKYLIINTLKKLHKQQCRCKITCECQMGGEDINNLYFYGKRKGAAELKFCIFLLEKMPNNELNKYGKNFRH